jgi:dihydrofolate reductase
MNSYPRVDLIYAVSEDGVIGKDGGLPWKLKRDLRYFRKITLGATVIMGRKTYESIGKPLKGRKNVVISSSLSPSTSTLEDNGLIIYSSLEEALTSLAQERIIIIGGKSVYELSLELDIVDTIYRTLVHTTIQPPTCFGRVAFTDDVIQFDADIGDEEKFIEMESKYFSEDEENEFAITFQVFGRIR